MCRFTFPHANLLAGVGCSPLQLRRQDSRAIRQTSEPARRQADKWSTYIKIKLNQRFSDLRHIGAYGEKKAGERWIGKLAFNLGVNKKA